MTDWPADVDRVFEDYTDATIATADYIAQVREALKAPSDLMELRQPFGYIDAFWVMSGGVLRAVALVIGDPMNHNVVKCHGYPA